MEASLHAKTGRIHGCTRTLRKTSNSSCTAGAVHTWAIARLERVVVFGTDQRITSGPAATAAASRWRQAFTRKQAAYMAAPERFAKRQIPLAPRAPSIHGPSRDLSAWLCLGPISGSHQGQRPQWPHRDGGKPSRENRPHTWLHPNASQNVKFLVAPRAPSIHGPSRDLSAWLCLGPISGSHQGQRPQWPHRDGGKPSRENRPHTYMAAPERFAKRQIPLAPRAPSIHGHRPARGSEHGRS